MKQILSVFLVILTVFALSSCGARSGGAGDTVDVNIPATFFSEEKPATEKLTSEQKKQGITKAVVHEDGSVTYSFLPEKYDGFLQTLKATTAEGLDQIIHDEDVKSIKKVVYNDDFSELTFTVDKKAFEGSMDGLTCYGAYLAVAFYKAYAQQEARCTVEIIDEATGDSLGTVVYPDALTEEATTEQ